MGDLVLRDVATPVLPAATSNVRYEPLDGPDMFLEEGVPPAVCGLAGGGGLAAHLAPLGGGGSGHPGALGRRGGENARRVHPPRR